MALFSVPTDLKHLTIFTQPKSCSENNLTLLESLVIDGKNQLFAQNLSVCSEISINLATSLIVYIFISTSDNKIIHQSH